MKRFLICTLLFASGWTALSCGRGGSTFDLRPVARLDGDVIPLYDFETVMRAPNPDTAADRQARERLLEQMINQKLIAMEGARLGYRETLAGAIEKAREATLERQLSEYAAKLPVTHRDIAAESSRVVNEVDLKLIEVATYDTALMVLSLLKRGEPFESLAVSFNRANVPGIGRDGDLGLQSVTWYPLEWTRAVAKMKPGDVSGLIIRAGIYYDFVKFVGQRLASRADSLAAQHAQIEESAHNRKVQEFMIDLRSKVQYDEGAIDYLTSRTDSVRPEDSLVVVARLPSGYKTRIGYLLPIVRSYPSVYPYLKRRALKEDIERDVLMKDAVRLGLDKTPAFQAQLQRAVDGTVYQYFYQKVITPKNPPTLDDARAYYQQHADNFQGKKFEDVGEQIRLQMQDMQRKQHHDSLLQALRARAKVEIDHKLLMTAKPADQ